MTSLPLIDKSFLLKTLRRLLDTPSPSGMTDAVVHVVCDILSELGIEYKLTRRGAIRATLPGPPTAPSGPSPGTSTLWAPR